MWLLRVEERPEARKHYYLGELAPRDVILGAESAVRIAAEYEVFYSGFDILVEPIARGYIFECGL